MLDEKKAQKLFLERVSFGLNEEKEEEERGKKKRKRTETQSERDRVVKWNYDKSNPRKREKITRKLKREMRMTM